jgi:hypothetical protein
MNGWPDCAGGGDVDDPAPSGLDHVRQHRLGAVEDAVQVDVDDPLPGLEAEVGEALEPVHAGRVDQDGDRAQLFPDGGQCLVYLRAVGHVGLLPGRRIGHFGRVEVEGGDAVALGAQPLRDGQADAGGTARDDGGLHVQVRARRSRLTHENLPSDFENHTLARTWLED